MVNKLEAVAASLSLLYTVLAIRQQAWCWLFGLLSTLLTVKLMLEANLVADVLLQIYYAGIACYGFWYWNKTSTQKLQSHLSEFNLTQHVMLAGTTGIVGFGLGEILAHFTQTDYPYLGAQISCFAVLATWMTARKIVSNWLYWVLIDAASLSIYLAKGLNYFSLLFLIYLILALIGYRQWKTAYQSLHAAKKSLSYTA
jgi:nicotinamide mononucleotide transporter